MLLSARASYALLLFITVAFLALFFPTQVQAQEGNRAPECGHEPENPCIPGIYIASLIPDTTFPAESGPYSYTVTLNNNGGIRGAYSVGCTGHAQTPCSVTPTSFQLATFANRTLTISITTKGVGGFRHTLNVSATPVGSDELYSEGNSDSFLSGLVTTSGATIVQHVEPIDGADFRGDTLRATWSHSSGINYDETLEIKVDGAPITSGFTASATGYKLPVTLTEGVHTWSTKVCSMSNRCDTYSSMFNKIMVTNWALDDSLAPDGSTQSGTLIGPLNPPSLELRGCAVSTGDPEISFINPLSFLNQTAPNGVAFVAVADTSTAYLRVETQTLAWLMNRSKTCAQLTHLPRSSFNYAFFSSSSPLDPRWSTYPFGDLAFLSDQDDHFDWMEPDAFELAYAMVPRGPNPPLARRKEVLRPAASASPIRRPAMMLPDPGPIDTLSWRVTLNGTTVIQNSAPVGGSGATVLMRNRLSQAANIPTSHAAFNTVHGWNTLEATIRDTLGNETSIRTRFLLEGGGGGGGSPAALAIEPLRNFLHQDQGDCAAFSAFQCDGVMLTAGIPGYVSRDRERGLNLVYRSSSQRARLTIPIKLTIDRAQKAPDSIHVTPFINGVEQTGRTTRFAGTKGAVTGANASNIVESRTEVRIVGAEIDSANGDVDIRKVRYRVRSFYQGVPFIDDTVSQDVVQAHLTTQVASRMGQGWQLAEVSRLVFTGPSGGLRYAGDTAAVWIAGDGSYSVFRKPGSTWLAAPGDNTRMVRLSSLSAGARYVFYLDNGASVGFREDGWQVWTRDLIGNATTFNYVSDLSNRIQSIVDPNGHSILFQYFESGKRSGYVSQIYLKGTGTDSVKVSSFEYDTVSNTNAVRLARIRTHRSDTVADSTRFTYRSGVAFGAFVDSIVSPGDNASGIRISRFSWDTLMWTPEKVTRPLGGTASIRFATRRASPRIGYGRAGNPLERALHINQWMGTYVPFAGTPFDYTADKFGGPTWVRNEARAGVYAAMTSSSIRDIVRDTTGRVVRIVKNRYNGSEADSVVYRYDALGRVDRVLRTTLEYPIASRTIDTMIFAYDTAPGVTGGQWCSRLLSVQDPFNSISKFLYDSTNGVGNCVPRQAIGTMVDTTKFTYSAFTTGFASAVRPVSIRDAFGNTTTVSYEGAHWNSDSLKEPLTTITTSLYDSLGRARSIRHPDSILTVFVRDRSGRVTHSRTGTGSLTPVTRVTFNSAGETVRTDVYRATTSDITELPDTGVQSTFNYFDALGRLDSIIHPGNRAGGQYVHRARKQSWKQRDDFGNPAWEYPGNGHHILRAYDARGQLIRMEQGSADPKVSSDGERYADSLTRAWQNLMILKSGKTFSAGNVHKYAYDAKGRLASTSSDDLYLQDTALVVRKYDYSRSDQLVLEETTFIEEPGARIVRRFKYNRRGQRVLATDSIFADGVSLSERVGTTEYVYDSTAGTLTSVIAKVKDTIYARADFLYDKGREYRRTITVDGGPRSLVTNTSYDALGRVTQIKTTNDLDTKTYYWLYNTSYNKVGDLKSADMYDGSIYRDLDYEYSTDGSRRLLAFEEEPDGNSYSYDVFGNRLTEEPANTAGATICRVQHNSTYGPDNRLRGRTVTGLSPCRSSWYFYDQAGQMLGESDTTKTNAPGLPPINGLRSLMTYTAGGQLYWSYTASGDLSQNDFNWHWYDGQGRRVISQIGSRTSLYPWPHPDSLNGAGPAAPRTYYIYDGNDVAIELVRSGFSWSVDRRFLSGGLDRPLAARMVLSTGLKGVGFVANRQGTVVQAIKKDGTEETNPANFSRDPYGNLIGVTGSGGGPMGGIGYTGAGTPNARGGFVYFRNRWYDPQSGRFLTQDPIGLAGGVNLYAYAGNNPIAFSDPFGLCPPLPDCIAQGLANWGAARGGVAGAVALNAGAGLNAGFEVLGINAASAAGEKIGSGDVVGGLTDAAILIGGGKVLGAALGKVSKIGTAAGGEIGGEISASSPVGRAGSELYVRGGTNTPATIGGRRYTGHALDQMQGRGLVPSVVEEAIANGAKTPGNNGATIYTTSEVRVILNPNGSVKTAMPQ